METGYSLEAVELAVRKVLTVQDVTQGVRNDPYVVRYRGRLISEDTEAAYDQVADALRPMNLTPLFRWDDNLHAVYVIPGKPSIKPLNPNINLMLFLFTLASVLWVGADMSLQGHLPAGLFPKIWAILSSGWPYALSMLAILGTHELGHYFMGRKHGVDVSLPFFIPLPLPPFGTLGAFINMGDPPKNRRHLLDIAIAGPLAGLMVAVPVLILGLSLSKVQPLPVQLPEGNMLQMEGNSLLYLLMKYLMFGHLLPAPVSYGAVPPLLYWLRYFFTGQPFPFGGTDVIVSPVAWAGWGGLLVTALNLIPAGQLDGGHILYVFFGKRRSVRFLPVILVALGVLGLAWPGWWLWVAVIVFLGRETAQPLDAITTLDNRRKLLCLVALILFVITFVPVPFTYGM